MNIIPNIRTGISVCPHDCPSACALEVELLDDHTIGRVRGAKDNSYTLGVICEKVGRYAERIHHPDRLLHPLKRKGPKGSGEFMPISWDDALGETAEAMLKAEAKYGRGGRVALLLRRHHGLRHARRHPPAAPCQGLLQHGRHVLRGAVVVGLPRWNGQRLGRRPARDAEVRPDRDLGRQPGQHPGQRDDPRDDGAQEQGRQDRLRRHLRHRHHEAGRRQAADPSGYGRCAGDSCHARAVPRRLCRLGLHGEVHRRAESVRRTPQDQDPGMGVEDLRSSGGRHRGLCEADRGNQEDVFPLRLWLHALAERCRQHACRVLHSGGDRRLAIRGWRARCIPTAACTASTRR